MIILKNQNIKQKKEALESFYFKHQGVINKIVVAVFIAATAIFVTMLFLNNKTTNDTAVSASETQRQRADQILQDAGWTAGTYTLEVDVSQDTSTSGDGAFSAEAVRTPDEMSEFLQGNSDSAKSILSSISETTGNTEEEILNSDNWIAVQSMVDFVYPGNTSFADGTVTGAGERQGKAGDIFLLYLPVIDQSDYDLATATTKANSLAVAVRAACANPQVILPTPLSTSESGGNDDNDKLSSKDPADDVAAPQGVTKQSAGDLTDGQQSAGQKSSGQTSGNVTDNPVGSGTTSGSTTTDTGSGVAVGGSSSSDNTNDDAKDDSATVYNSGGTNGNTEIAEP